MKISLFYKAVMLFARVPAIFVLAAMALPAVWPEQLSADEAGTSLPEFYRGLLDGYYVELVVDWLPDKRVEGEIWTAAHKVTPAELGFVFAKVKGENQKDGHLEIEIMEDEISHNNGAGSEKLGVASLRKRLTGDYIEWEGEYRRSTGARAPMIMYRERTYSGGPEKAGEHEQEETAPDRDKYARTDSCEDGVCVPVRIEVCIKKENIGEAQEYFAWLKFPVGPLCGTGGESECVSDPLCAGEAWAIEVDGFSEPYWEQELRNLPFITAVRRSTRGMFSDTGIVEMPVASFFPDSVPDYEEAVKKIGEFLNGYFSEALRNGAISMTMRERTRFNYLVDIRGESSVLSLRKPGFREYHQLSIVMSQPYPYDQPDKFAVYIGLPGAQYSEWTEKAHPPSGKGMNIQDDARAAFLEKVVSAFAHKYRAAVWTP